ncbi:C6 zinc finger domain protein [Colletotrichum plurivorum]|uniref:C6 zinc finger domain protein n=1 Tax=Colletotrichum plurivorum TaxID=2175906 RepID=A0A8H6N9B4_9PEZI|nr:C6 zinc finger domain protein [Colletotrichum plurivorum]
MTRHGLPKVKTGCITCKLTSPRIRRVKCDEARPACNRCVSTGRKCDGYVQPPNGSYSWAQLLRVRPPPTHPAAEPEIRAWGFFRTVVAPVLAGPMDSYFWTHIVPQVSEREEAVKHAVLAISSLYEKFRGAPVEKAIGEKNMFAVTNYNDAIRHLRTTDAPETVLLVCILFTCIDMLRGETIGAISHSRHGINILNGSGPKSRFVRDHLEPAFCRLGIFPLFFGVRPETFPILEVPESTSTAPFNTLAELQAAYDPLIVRTIRFIRKADEYRLGDDTIPEPNELMLEERRKISAAMDRWDADFANYKKEKLGRDTERIRERELMAAKLLEMGWLVGRIWIDSCLSRKETIFDQHLDRFQRLIDIGSDAATFLRSWQRNHPRAKFTFEMGFGPLLGFVVIKCRSLRLRLAALKLMRTLGHERETLWDNDTVLALGRTMIEVEHEVHLDPDGKNDDVVDGEILPAEGKRIKDSAMQSESRVSLGKDGAVTAWKKLCLLMRQPGGPVTVKEVWFSVHPKRKQ